MLPRIASILVLVALVALFGILFYQVMAGFLMPVFMAILATILVQPLFAWLLGRLGGSRRWAAAATTGIVLIAILIPVVYLGASAVTEAIRLTKNPEMLKLDPQIMQTGVDWLNARTHLRLDAEEVQAELVVKAQTLLTPLAVGTSRAVLDFLVGLTIMLIALYYFLLDGDEMIRSTGKLLPLDLKYQESLLTEFSQVSRAVAAATLLSALGQGILAGIGYYFAGLDSLALLIMATMLASLIPFVGAALVWIPCALWLIVFADKFWPGVFLAIYGVAVVSMVDNLVKPFILQGRTNLHPLLALLSVLGGVQALGPIGIFVGPMTVVFLQAALTMLQAELRRAPAVYP